MTLLALLLIAGVSMVVFPLVGLLIRTASNQLTKKALTMYTVSLVCGGFLTTFTTLQVGEHREQESILADAEWRRNGCRVYRTECGSKHKYACEVKTNVQGKAIVGDLVLETYPTCR